MQKPANLQQSLEDYLKGLVVKSGLGKELFVVWTPKPDYKYEGEVKNNLIVIYSGTFDEARKTLKHEFLEYIVTKAASPYKDIINLQRTVLNSIMRQLEEQAYQDKEKAVTALENLFE